MKDRHRTVEFFVNAFGYHVQTEFDIKFPDGSSARCFALEPPEKICNNLPWEWEGWESLPVGVLCDCIRTTKYHLAPEIFVSDGTPDSIVGEWVSKRGGIGGIHHLAYQVDSVQAQMDDWRAKGYAEFTTEQPLTCPDLIQVFTKPSELTGVIYEFIERGTHGFCKDNVQSLMESTRGMDGRLAADFPTATL